jgi:hypothetical protein
MSARSRLGTACVVLALAPAAAACGGGGGGPAAPSGQQPRLVTVTDGSSTSAQTRAAAHWWSTGADYCTILRQTLRAGRSILPGVTAKDPALLASTKAFLADLEAAAPAAVAGPWHVLGHAVITLVASGGDPTKVKGVDAAAVRRAASTVAAQARHSCGVDLSVR